MTSNGEVQSPVPDENEVKVKITCCLYCGADDGPDYCDAAEADIMGYPDPSDEQDYEEAESGHPDRSDTAGVKGAARPF